MYPDDVKYTKTHEWVRVSNGEAAIGITDYAQEELGDIVAVELPAAGTKVKAGEVFGSVDSVKAVSELISPVSGEVRKSNTELENSPEKINEDPYGEGWMLIVQMFDTTELEGLMTADEYKAFVEQA